MTKNVQDLYETTQFLFQKSESPVNSTEMNALISKAQEGDIQSRNRLLMMHIRYIVKMAASYASKTCSISDLVHEGCIGFMTAIDRFDITRPVKLLTYATYWIRQRITTKLFQHEHLVKVPFNKYRSVRKQDDIHPSWDEALQKEAPVKSIAARWRNHAFERAAKLSVLSLDLSLDSAESMYGYTSHPDAQVPDQLCMEKALEDALAETTEQILTSREREVIYFRYGLSGRRRLTFQELSQRLRISRERVRQIELTAIKKLQSSILARRKLMDFLQESS